MYGVICLNYDTVHHAYFLVRLLLADVTLLYVEYAREALLTKILICINFISLKTFYFSYDLSNMSYSNFSNIKKI